MEVSGLTLGVLREVLTIGKSIIVRIARIKEEPSRFASVCEYVMPLVTEAQKVSDIVEENTTLFPVGILPMILELRSSVRNALLDVDRRLEKYCADTTSGIYRRLYANELAERLEAIKRDAKHAKEDVRFLLTQLNIVLTWSKTRQKPSTAGDVQMTLDVYRRPKKITTADEVLLRTDLYRPCSNAPELEHSIGYFQGFSTSLQAVKFELLRNDSSQCICFLSLKGGFGKKLRLQWLAQDEAVQKHFCAGIVYLSLRGLLSDQHVILELAKNVRNTGGEERATKIESMSSAAAAITAATEWFKYRPVLVMCDGLYSPGGRAVEYLEKMQRMCLGSSGSRMIISSRSPTVAARCGSIVDVAPTTQDLVNIVFCRAQQRETPICIPQALPYVRDIADECADLPLAAALAGCAIGLRARSGVDFAAACRKYLDNLRQQRTVSGSLFEAMISLNLWLLDDLCLLREAGVSMSARDLYLSFCVLNFKQRISFSDLAQMWDVDVRVSENVCFILLDAGLAKPVSPNDDDTEPKSCVCVHDDFLEFCRRFAEEENQTEIWQMRWREIRSNSSLFR